jgi:hypothetical protein
MKETVIVTHKANAPSAIHQADSTTKKLFAELLTGAFANFLLR